MDIKRESLVSWANTNRRFSFNFPLFVLMLRSNNRRQLLAPGCWRMILWGWDFVWPLFFVAFLGPVSSQRFQAATRQDTRRRKEDGRDGVGVGKKGDDLRRRQYLRYPNIGTANVLEKSVALFRFFLCVIFKQAPPKVDDIYVSFI